MCSYNSSKVSQYCMVRGGHFILPASLLATTKLYMLKFLDMSLGVNNKTMEEFKGLRNKQQWEELRNKQQQWEGLRDKQQWEGLRNKEP